MTSNADDAAALERGKTIATELQNASSDALQWYHASDLKLEHKGAYGGEALDDHYCARGCGKRESATKRFAKCARCSARYCSRACQVQDWKRGGHKELCPMFKLVLSGTFSATEPPSDTSTAAADKVAAEGGGGGGGGEGAGGSAVPAPVVCGGAAPTPAARRVVARLVQRLRMYLCPFACVHAGARAAGGHPDGGRGFVYLKTEEHPLASFVFEEPLDAYGRPLNRLVVIEYLSVPEWKAHICKDNFELAAVQPDLARAVAGYDPLGQVVVLVATRCGFVGVVVAPLVPDRAISSALGRQYGYADKQKIGLNVDARD